MASDLKLENFSDREILHLLNDHAGDEGWVDLGVLAQNVGLVKPEQMNEVAFPMHVRRCLAVRLSWIRRLSGTVERHTNKQTPYWRLTQRGHEVITAQLPTTVRVGLGVVDGYAALSALNMIAQRYMGSTPEAANLMRREWLWGTHRNRR